MPNFPNLQPPRRNRFIFPTVFFIAFLGMIPILHLGFFALAPYREIAEKSATIYIHKGQTPADVTRILSSENLISDGKSFLWLGRISRQWKKIKAGEYQISSSMTPIEIFSVLTSGVSVAYPITVREGENMYEIAKTLKARVLADSNVFLILCQNPKFIASLKYFNGMPPTSLEGYLAPDTYFFNKTMSEEDIARAMVRHFFEFWGPKEEARIRELKLTRHQLVTLASMIEKETGAPEERSLISSVFHNRLRKKMKLQSDPTTIYGMWERYQGKIHKSDLFEKNTFNTYVVEGLPSGPISNPSKEAIQAALYPADSPYFYFVSHNDGTHQFSTTFEEHHLAVRKFQIDPKARIGKSWRDRLRQPSNQLNR